MELFNFSKLVEQGVYDVMMWIFFYPFTFVRTLIWPRKSMVYVREQSALDPQQAFANAIRPALFLFISICLISFISPMDNSEIARFQRSELGKILLGSPLPMLIFNMVIFSLMPFTGAVLLDSLTPGRVTRNSLRLPFEQQCYIAAPFVLLLSIMAYVYKGNASKAEVALFVLLILWYAFAQYCFFRDNSSLSKGLCAILAFVTIIAGFMMIFLGLALTVGYSAPA